MSEQVKPRVRVADTARKGEVLEIKTLISHVMETGQRKDAAGNVVPRKIINKLTAQFGDKVFFEADWHPSVSANPFQSFFFKAQESGEFTFTWKDDDGSVHTSKHKLTVA